MAISFGGRATAHGGSGFSGGGGGGAGFDPRTGQVTGPTPSTEGRQTQTLGAESRLTQNQFDPTREFLANMIMGQVEAGQAQIPQEVMDAIKGVVTDPGAIGSIAGPQFQQIAGPLLQALQPEFDRQIQAQSDIFRKAGAQQSGAFAKETSNLLERQGAQSAQALASAYIPLLGALSERQIGGIEAGVKTPQQFTSLAQLLGAFDRPVATLEQGTSLPSATIANPYYNPLQGIGGYARGGGV